jgi:hypothetical protein
MEEYKVIKPILKGRTINTPYTFSQKVLVKVGTILYAERDNSRIGSILVLKRKDNDRYVCDVGSLTANEHCIKC